MTVSFSKGKNDGSDWANITGYAMYARLNEPKTFPESYVAKAKNADEVFPFWGIDVLIDKATATLLEDRGIKIRGTGRTKKDERNPRYVEFVRANGLEEKGFDGTYIEARKSTMRKAYKNGAVVVKNGKPVFEAASPPAILDSAENNVPQDLLIGNGSLVRLRTNVYGPNFGDFRLRLVNVTILDLVEYKKDNGGSFVYQGDTSQSTVDDEDDDSPFKEAV